MGLRSRMRRWFGGDDEPSTAPDLQIGDLSERLRLMRGNITTPMGPAPSAPRASDSVQQMSKAAHDARFIDRSNEDDVLQGVKKYRSLDDR